MSRRIFRPLSPALFLLCWLFPFPLTAAPGATTGDILKLPLSPRALGMGEAFTAVRGGIDSISYNPAGLASLRGHEVKAMHAILAAGTRQEEFAYGVSTPWGSIAGEFMSLGSGSLDAFDANDNPVGTVRSTDYLFRLGYARRLFRNLDVGLAGSFLYEDLAGATAQTGFADAGLRAHFLGERLALGFAYRNLGPGLKFDKTEYPLPRTPVIGAAWQQKAGRWNRFTAAADILLPDGRSLQAHGGVEVWFLDTVALRAGYVSEQGLGPGLRFGAGLYWKGIGIDYALASQGDFGDAHRFGFSYRFGRKGASRARTLAATAPVLAEKPLPREIADLVSPRAAPSQAGLDPLSRTPPGEWSPIKVAQISAKKPSPRAAVELPSPGASPEKAEPKPPSRLSPARGPAVLENIHVEPRRVTLHLSARTQFHIFRRWKSSRLVIDLHNTRHGTARSREGMGPYLSEIRSGESRRNSEPVTRVVLYLQKPASYLARWNDNKLDIRLAPLKRTRRPEPKKEVSHEP